MENYRRLRDLFSFPGFVARAKFKEELDDSDTKMMAKVVTLHRKKKRQYVRTADIAAVVATISARTAHAICQWLDAAYTWNLRAGAYIARGVLACT